MSCVFRRITSTGDYIPDRSWGFVFNVSQLANVAGGDGVVMAAVMRLALASGEWLWQYWFPIAGARYSVQRISAGDPRQPAICGCVFRSLIAPVLLCRRSGVLPHAAYERWPVVPRLHRGRWRRSVPIAVLPTRHPIRIANYPSADSHITRRHRLHDDFR